MLLRMSSPGREPLIAVQHGKVRYLGNDSHYAES